MPFQRPKIPKLRIFTVVVYAGLICMGVWVLVLGDITSLIFTGLLVSFLVSDLSSWRSEQRKPELETG